jgi:hypothetical protein
VKSRISLRSIRATSFAVIASEAKQSRTRRTCKMDCFVASLLATTSGTPSRSRRAFSREFCLERLPSSLEGAGNAGRLMRPQPRVQSRKHTSSHHGHTGITRHSPRNGFTVSFVLSPVTGLVCHRRRRSCLHRLDASVGASGPHDFAVRFSAIRQRRRSVHRIPPRVRDDRERPSEGRDGQGYIADLPDGLSEIFLQGGTGLVESP